LNLEPRSIWRKINRLFRALSPAQARPDDVWAAKQLPVNELGIYQRMDPRDREHAVRVAQKLLELHPEARSEVVRAAILHDCGKLVRPYNVLERVIVGLIAPEGPRASKLKSGRINSSQSTSNQSNSNQSNSNQSNSNQENSSRIDSNSAMDVRNKHPVIGAKLILEAGGDARVAELVRIHHSPNGDLEATWIHEIDDLE
jgi:hypothetical protein